MTTNFLAEIRNVEEFSTTEIPPHVNHAENTLETNPYLLYGIMTALLVILIIALIYRKKRDGKDK